MNGQEYLDKHYPIKVKCEVCGALEPEPPLAEMPSIAEVITRETYPRWWLRLLARVAGIDRKRYACCAEHLRVVVDRMTARP